MAYGDDAEARHTVVVKEEEEEAGYVIAEKANEVIDSGWPPAGSPYQEFPNCSFYGITLPKVGLDRLKMILLAIH